MEETYQAAKVAATSEDIDFPAVLRQNVGKELELHECYWFPFVLDKMRVRFSAPSPSTIHSSILVPPPLDSSTRFTSP